MRNKMKKWRALARSVKLALAAVGKHERGARYGKRIRVLCQPPQHRGGPVPFKAPSPLLSGLLKRQASWPVTEATRVK